HTRSTRDWSSDVCSSDLTSTKILTRRRLGAHGVPHAPVVVRRRRTRGFVQVASSVTAERLRLNTFGHAYLGLGGVLIAVLFYLEIGRASCRARVFVWVEV